METRNRGRNALDSKLLPLRRLKARVVTPRGGWIVAIRQALGMTTTQMAQRLGVSQSNIVQMEMAESEGRIKLETLKRAAEALNCTLLYALVPNDTLEHTTRERALRLAAERMGSVTHTMALENQTTSEKASKGELKRMADEILEREPSAIWTTK